VHRPAPIGGWTKPGYDRLAWLHRYSRRHTGALLIDIIVSKRYKLLKRSYATRLLLSNPTAEARAERMQEAVDSVFNGVRFVH